MHFQARMRSWLCLTGVLVASAAPPRAHFNRAKKEREKFWNGGTLLPPGAPPSERTHSRDEIIGNHLTHFASLIRPLGASSQQCEERQGWCAMWRAELVAFRRRVAEQERARIEDHARLFGAYMPSDNEDRELGIVAKMYGTWSIFEFFEPEYACADTSRVPSNMLGRGPKWVCGPDEFHHYSAGRAASIGLYSAPARGYPSRDAFEAGMHRLSPCDTHVVAPRATADVAYKLKAEYGAHLDRRPVAANHTLSTTSMPTPRISPGSRSISTPRTLPTSTLALLERLVTLCAAGRTLAHLNVAFHLDVRVRPRRFYRIFRDLRHVCQLMLHSREPDLWTDKAAPTRHCDFAWVAFAHARRLPPPPLSAHQRHPGPSLVITTAVFVER